MKRLALLVAVVGCFSCLAQESATYLGCMNSAATQIAMTVCASEESARSEAVLNDLYRGLLLTTANRPKAAAKIEAAQRAWIIYRDAYLDAMYPEDDKQKEYGTSYAMDLNLLRARLTKRQIDELKALLEQYNR